MVMELGLIGCGGIARNRHLPALERLRLAGRDQDVEVHAVADSALVNAEIAADWCAEHLGRRPLVYQDYRQMLSDTSLDAVDICLPHGLHHVAGIAAFEAGLHVVLEKPFTVTMKTGRALVDAGEKAGRILALAVPMRRMPGQRAAAWAINQAKLIGDPWTFFCHDVRPRPPVQRPAASAAAPAVERRPVRENWRADRRMSGGAMVVDSGFHFMDTIRMLFGEVEQVYAELRGFGPDGANTVREGRENTAIITFTFESGLVGSWTWSAGLIGQGANSLIFYGSEGSLEDTGTHSQYAVYHLFMNGGELTTKGGEKRSLDQLKEEHLAWLSPAERERLFPGGVTDEFAIELHDFFQAVRTGGSPEVDGDEGLKTLALPLAVYESGYVHTAVKIRDVLDRTVHAYQDEIDAEWPV
ncbi:MAG: Gfo/Idh/MocA family oxidoreductase [Chloroflexi bacterium]|nr:Gfo/Idh/MocA family oxidoreductase [Chloroflexota bacterium]